MELNGSDTRPIQPTTAVRTSNVADERRRVATAKHIAAIATIDALFDCVDDLRTARDRLTSIEPARVDADPIRDAQAAIDATHRLEDALGELRRAAERAAAHRSRADLASDIGTRQAALFPRKPTTPRERDEKSPSTAVGDDHAGEVS